MKAHETFSGRYKEDAPHTLDRRTGIDVLADGQVPSIQINLHDSIDVPAKDSICRCVCHRL